MALRACPSLAARSGGKVSRMRIATLREVHLTHFKSFKDATLPLSSLTVLTGRNSSGKSNALDGIEVLSRLATGEEIGDALDGRRREGGSVRGGSAGCAPHGSKYFQLGCVVDFAEQVFRYTARVQVSPELRITGEWLRGPGPALESGIIAERDFIVPYQASENDPSITVEIYNGKRGNNPQYTFRDNRLIVTQLESRLAPKNEADEAVLRAAAAVVAALRGTFQLDPIPHLMRDYVPERDADLRRTGENISAALSRLTRADNPTFVRLLSLVREVADEPISGLTVEPSSLGDVMFGLREGSKRTDITPAREMSDGLLRFIAIATALLTANRGLDIDTGTSLDDDLRGAVLLVIEELENGLHPSQAERVLHLIRETSAEYGTKVLLTTHSPALLNAIVGEANKGVIVCYRDARSGKSKLTRLTQLPGYAEAMARGRLGDVVTAGQLVRPTSPNEDFEEFNRLLGIG